MIRPAELPGADGQRLVVGSGTTMKTWTSTAPVATAPVATAPVATAPTATAPVATGAVDVKVTGPTQVSVGGNATFSVLVTNLGQTPTPSLLMKDRFCAGLEHAVAKSPIERELGVLAAGESRRIEVTFRAAKAGRLCHTVEITGGQGLQASAEGCVTAVAGPVTGGVVVPGGVVGADLDLGPPQRPDEQAGRRDRRIHHRRGEHRQSDPDESESGRQLRPQPRSAAGRRGIQVREQRPGLDHRLARTRQDRTTAGRSLPLPQPAAKACNRVAVIAEDGSKFEDEACLEIARLRPA